MAPLSQATLPELWAGIECTVNRVGDRYFDQMRWSGHADPERIDDLDRIAALGIRAIRYPVLWEHVAPGGLDNPDWDWSDARLERLQLLGVRPIVGLLHHGSGPRYTSLVDPAFPELLARYARLVAERYSWVRDWTPVNEPLTTARFSAAYGHWYPHAHDNQSFARALTNQIRGTVLAMRAIREVIPDARLIQTEDLGKTFSTAPLTYQADYDNIRRWTTWDLLTGRVNPAHPLWKFLVWAGEEPSAIDWFRENACPPDVLGINHYVTSDRFLDHELECYPEHFHGGNGRDRYVDVEAVRGREEGSTAAGEVLREAWDRYQLPVAVTEVHLGSTREEQLRWLLDIWRAARDLGREGVDVRAITVWAVLGSFDWKSLVTCDHGDYEPGMFDVRAPVPRLTALGRAIRDIATNGDSDHPVLDVPGWWRRPDRLLYSPDRRGTHVLEWLKSYPAKPRPLMILGDTGMLGQAFARIVDARGLSYVLVSYDDLDMTDASSIEQVLDHILPWAVINTAEYSQVDRAESERVACFAENAIGPTALATACAARGIQFVGFSSDLVFDGQQRTPYTEHDPPSPLNVYGRSKSEMESRVLEQHPRALVVRSGPVFSAWDDDNFVTRTLRKLVSGHEVVAAGDLDISPTYVVDLVHACLDLLIDGERGIWHLANREGCSWAELAIRAAQMASLDTSRIIARPSSEFCPLAPRPSYSVLASTRGWIMPSLDDALASYFEEGRRIG